MNNKQEKEFYTFVIKGFLIYKRACHDIYLIIIFLCKQVKDPNQDNWDKLI